MTTKPTGPWVPPYKDLPPAEAVVAAWSVEGPVPAYHYEAQQRLQAEWPLLAAALHRLASAYATDDPIQ